MKEKLDKYFVAFASRASRIIGSPPVFIAAVVFVLLWFGSGPIFKFSDTWELIINTTTAIITFLAVFIIQNTQNRNDEATQLKLDELIHAIKNARNEFIDIEDLDDEQLDKLRDKYKKYKDQNPKEVEKKKK